MSDDPEFVNYRIMAATVDGGPMPLGEAEFRIIGTIEEPLADCAEAVEFVFRIGDWAGPLPPEAFAPPLTDAGGLQWVDAANTAWQAWEEYSEARDRLCAAGALLRLSDAMDSLASWLPGYNADTGRVDDVGLCESTNARAAFLTGEGTLTAAEVQAWALELGGQMVADERWLDVPLMVSIVQRTEP